MSKAYLYLYDIIRDPVTANNLYVTFLCKYFNSEGLGDSVVGLNVSVADTATARDVMQAMVDQAIAFQPTNYGLVNADFLMTSIQRGV